MVVVLGVLVAFDFLLLFMAMTGVRDLVTAWNLSAVDQLTWFSTFGLLIMNLLTLLRCASVMNTSTTELNRRAVEERNKAIAEESLIDAGDATRSEALKVWQQLGTNPVADFHLGYRKSKNFSKLFHFLSFCRAENKKQFQPPKEVF